MAELGIAAAAAQFLDHSIKVVFQLSWFCSEVRSTPEKLHALQAEIAQQTSLANSLLRNLGTPSAFTAGFGDLHQIVQDYNDLLDCIAQMLDRFSNHASDGQFRRGWNTVRAVLSKDEIQKLCSQLNDKRDLLCVWLGNMNLLTATQVHGIVSQSRTLIEGHLSVLQQIAASSSRIENFLSQMQPVVAEIREISGRHSTSQQRTLDEVNFINTKINSLSHEWQDLGKSMATFKSLLDENPRLARAISQVASQPKPQTESPISDTASCLRQTYSNAIRYSEKANSAAELPSGAPFEGCVCRGVSRAKTVEPLSLVHFRHVFKHYHYRHCPKFNDSERSLELVMRIAPPSWLLRHTVNITIKVRNWHTIRGFSIAPTIHGGSRVVDAEMSPSFRAIMSCRERLNGTSFQDSAACLRDFIVTLKDVFESGQGSPLDEDIQGHTILYEVLCFFVAHAALARHSSTAKPPEEYLALAQFLLRHGANPNVLCSRSASDWSWDRPTTGSGTSLDMFAASLERFSDSSHNKYSQLELIWPRHQEVIGHALYRVLVDSGAEFSRPTRPLEGVQPASFCGFFREELVYYQLFPEQLDLSDQSPLVSAILSRSQDEFSRLLQHSDYIDHTSSVNGLTASHFAVVWPWALERLIQSGADINVADFHNRRPIQLAVALGKADSVRLLLEADCSISTPSDALSLLQEALESATVVGGKSMTAPGMNGSEVVNEVIKALGPRHRRLVNFAMAVLPESLALRGKLDRDNLKEFLAPMVIQELADMGVEVPRALELDGKGVYNGAPYSARIQLTPAVAQTLWDAGFNDVEFNVKDDDNASLPPMLRCWYTANLGMAAWFRSNGVSVTSTWDSKTGRSGLHFYVEGLCYNGVIDLQERRSDAVEKLIEEIIDDSAAHYDDCSCLCSPRGCTPLSRLPRLARRMRLDASGTITMEEIREIDGIYRAWLDLVGPARGDSAVREILRAVAFEQLEGVHTCCITIRGIDRTREIRDMSLGLREEWDETEKAEFEDKLRRVVDEYDRKLEACCCEKGGKPLCLLSGAGDWRCISLANTGIGD